MGCIQRVDSGDPPLVALAAGENGALAGKAGEEAGFVPGGGQVAEQFGHEVGLGRHAFGGLAEVLHAGLEEHGQGEFEAFARALLDRGQLGKDHGGVVHGIEDVAREGEKGGVPGGAVGIILREGDELHAHDRLHRHEIRIRAVPPAGQGGAVGVDRQLVARGGLEKVVVVGHDGLAVAGEEVDLHALDAHRGEAGELGLAALGREQPGLGRVGRAVPVARRVVPENEPDALVRGIVGQCGHALIADVPVPVHVHEGVVPAHLRGVVDEGLLRLLVDRVVLEHEPAPGGLAGLDPARIRETVRRGEVGPHRRLDDRAEFLADHHEPPGGGPCARRRGLHGAAKDGLARHRIAEAKDGPGFVLHEPPAAVVAPHVGLGEENPRAVLAGAEEGGKSPADEGIHLGEVARVRHGALPRLEKRHELLHRGILDVVFLVGILCFAPARAGLRHGMNPGVRARGEGECGVLRLDRPLLLRTGEVVAKGHAIVRDMKLDLQRCPGLALEHDGPASRAPFDRSRFAREQGVGVLRAAGRTGRQLRERAGQNRVFGFEAEGRRFEDDGVAVKHRVDGGPARERDLDAAHAAGARDLDRLVRRSRAVGKKNAGQRGQRDQSGGVV